MGLVDFWKDFFFCSSLWCNWQNLSMTNPTVTLEREVHSGITCQLYKGGQLKFCSCFQEKDSDFN